MRHRLAVLVVVVLAALLAASSAWADPAYVQKACNHCTATTCTTPTINTTTGNLIVINYNYRGTLTSITDNGTGNSWSQALPETGDGVAAIYGQQYGVLANGKTGHSWTITVTPAQHAGVCVLEFTNPTATPLDKTVIIKEGSASTSHSSGTTASRSQASEVLVGIGGTASTFTAATTTGAWTGVDVNDSNPDNGMISAYQIVSSVGTDAFTYTTSNSVVAVSGVATYKAAVAAGCTHTRMTLTGAGC